MTFRFPDAALSQHIAILGKTGSGKTSTAKLVVEQVVADGSRVCILDPIKSDWWGLTASADGHSPGLPFHILGGPRGHLPLPASAGTAVGKIVATGGVPLSIIDMAEFGPGDHARFFSDFAEALMKNMRGVVYLAVEEAHLFAPKERAGLGSENIAIHYAKMLATAGRSKGIRLILATQRVQALHNALLGSCDTLVAHRFTAPADQKPITDWLKANADKAILQGVVGSLSSLPTGTGWVCSGEAKLFELVAFPRIRTFDNTATPTGEMAQTEVQTASVNIANLRGILGEAIKEAEENDPKALRAEIVRLTKQLEGKGGAPPAPVVDLAAVARARDEGVAEGRRQVVEEYRPILAAIRRLAQDVLAQVGDAPTAPPVAPVVVRTESRPRPASATPKPAAASGADGLLAIAVRHWPAQLTWAQVAALGGRKARGGHFNTSRKALIDNGLVADRADIVEITDAGFEHAGGKPEKPVDLVQAYLAALPTPANKMLDILVRRPRIEAEDLAIQLAMQPRGGHWNTGLSTLARCGLIKRTGTVIILETQALVAKESP